MVWTRGVRARKGNKTGPDARFVRPGFRKMHIGKQIAFFI